MSSTAPLLRTEDLTKYYETADSLLDRLLGGGGQVQAVDGVDIEIGAGETLALVGESGCGKSSLGRTLLRLHEPTAGAVYYRDDDEVVELTALSSSEMRAYRTDLQIIFQNPFASLNPRLTVGDIIGEPLDVHGLATGTDRHERIGELLDLVGLQASHAGRYPHEFSGGQRQRIGIARALAVDPSFVVCDEPVSALDVSVQAQILNLLVDLQNRLDLSYLFIAHDLSVVEHIADRVAIMYLGEIVESGPTEAVFEPPYHPYTESLLSAIPEPDPLWEGDRIELAGTVPSALDPPSGCRFHTRCHRIIPPDDVAVDQSVYREIIDLRRAILDRSIPVARIAAETETDRPDQDPTQAVVDILFERRFESALAGVHRERVQEALTHVANSDWQQAETVLEHYESICEHSNPVLQPAEPNPRACHLYDQPATPHPSDSGED